MSNLSPSVQTHDTFVGRVRELQEFRTSVRYLLGHELPPSTNTLYPHIFLPHGEGGMGKSALLRRFVRVACDEGLPAENIILVDLDYKRYANVEALAQLLAQAIRQKHSEIDNRYQQARKRRELLTPRYHDLERQWARWESLRGIDMDDLDTLLHAHRRTLVQTEIQQAKFGSAYEPVYLAAQADEATHELAALLAFREDRGHVPPSFDELIQREFGPDAMLFQQGSGLGQALAEDLYELAEAAPVLLAIDTYERADCFDDWLRTTILAQSSDRMLTVIAGRNRLDAAYRRTFSGPFTNLIRSYNLNDQPFEAGEIRDYLMHRLKLLEEPPQTLVDQVQSISRGIPMALEALGDQLAANGNLTPYQGMDLVMPDRRAVVRMVTERFLRYALNDKNDDPPVREQKLLDRQRIRSLAILLQPDPELACAIWGVPIEKGQEVIDDLADRYSFIFAGYGPFEIHDLVREFVREDTLAEGRQSFDWPALERGLRRAISVIQGRIAQIEQRIDGIVERCTYPEWRLTMLDQCNALLWLGEDVVVRRLLVNHWIEARYTDLAFADALTTLAVELAPKTPDWQHIVQFVTSSDYQPHKPVVSLIEPRPHSMLYYLRAEHARKHAKPNEDSFQRLNRHITLLERGYALNESWRQISSALAEAYLDRGLYYHQKLEDLRSALTDYDRSIELRPNRLATLILRGEARYRIGNLAGALADYDSALSLHPNNRIAFLRRGLVRHKLGDFAGAVADYDRALELRPDHAFTLTSRGDAKQKLGDLVGALADYDRSLELRPNHPYTLTNRGFTKHLMGDVDEALVDYDQSLSIFPDHAFTLTRRGMVKRKFGDYDGSLADLNRALELRPDHPHTLTNRAITKYKLGNLIGALEDFDRALRLQPDHAFTLTGRGDARSAAGDLVGALADYDRSLAVHPDNWYTCNQRGQAKQALGRWAEALEDYRQAADLAPGEAPPLYNVACVYALEGQVEVALDWLARAIALAPERRATACADASFTNLKVHPRFCTLTNDAGVEQNSE